MNKLLLRVLAGGLAWLLLAGLAAPRAAQAQAPAWRSAQNLSDNTAGTNNTSFLNASIDDGNGNVYLAGSFGGTIRLGTTTLVATTGRTDLVVAKYNVASGQYLWVTQAGGVGIRNAQAVAVVGTSVYVTGSFSGAQAGFGSTTLVNASASTTDIFVAKLTDAGTSGSFTWAVRAGGTAADGDIVLDVRASSAGIYLTGNFKSARPVFGSTVLVNAGGASDAFVAKLTDAGTSGSFAWALGIGGSGGDYGIGLTVVGSTLYVGGAFSATCPFGAATLTSAGGLDGFTTKLTDTGSGATFIWTQQFGGTGDEEISGLAVSGSTVYLAGDFDSPTLPVGSTTLATAGSYDVLLAKLTDTGSSSSVVWALRGGGPDADYPYSQQLVLRGTALYTAGVVGSNAPFGSTTLLGAGGRDVLLLKTNDNGSTGSFAWAKRAGGSDNDYGTGLSVVDNTIVVCGGYYSQAAGFDNLTLTNPYSGNSYGFLATTSTTALATQAAQLLPASALYPNPAHGRVTVQVPAATGPATLRLRDALGRVVREASAPAGQLYDLDLMGLAPGVYVVQVQAGEALATRPLVVE